MKKAISCIVFFVILFFWGCKTDPKKGIVVFPISKNAALSEIEIADVLAMPMNLLIRDNEIIIYDAMTDWVFKIFSRERFEFKGNLMRRGPMEELEVSYLFRSFEKDAFIFQSTSSLKVAKIQFDNTDMNLFVIDEYALPTDMYGESDFFLLNDKLCSAISFQSPSRDFRCFDFNTHSTYEWGEFLPLQRPASFSPNEIFYMPKYTTVNSDRSLLAVGYQNLPTLRIYCAQSGRMLYQLHMADGSKNEEFFIRNSFEAGFLTYYCLLKSTSEFIYALYSGVGISFEDEKIPDFASVLHVWQWDGTPVMTLELDRSIFSFDITPDNKQIIASSIVDVDKLFVAEIPWD